MAEADADLGGAVLARAVSAYRAALGSRLLAGYVLVRFDPRSLRMVLEAAGELAGASARAVCWNTAIDGTRQAELPVPAFAAMLAGYDPRIPDRRAP